MAGKNLFVFYEDKTSLKKKNSRYVQGGVTEFTENKVNFWDRLQTFNEPTTTDVELVVTPEYDTRPDLMASDLYGRADLEWIILQFNNIVDINEEFVAGAVIRAPSRERVFNSILSKRTPSTNVR